MRDLEVLGAEGAWDRLYAADLRDTLRDALALEGAIRNLRKAYMDPDARERLSAHIRAKTAPERRL